MTERRRRTPTRRRGTVADAEWRTRMVRAAATLNAASRVAGLALSARAVELRDVPAATALVGQRMLASARTVGLLAGSFNPLTRAHVALAEAARAAGGLEVIAWTLAVDTINKERVERATFADRLAQLQSYCTGRNADAVVVANRGLYVDQARALHELMAPDARLAIVIGYDKVVQIFDPRYYADRNAALTDLFREAELLVAPRAGQGPHELEQLLSRPENARFTAAVRPMPLAPDYAADSSSQVRALASVASAAAPRTLVTPEGWALARLGAYLPDDERNGPGAVYATREAWERALPGLPASLVSEFPPITALVRRTRGASGSGLREWLLERDAGPDALAALLR